MIFELDRWVYEHWASLHMPIFVLMHVRPAYTEIGFVSVHTHKEYITSNIITGIVRLAFSIWHVMHPCGCLNFTSFFLQNLHVTHRVTEQLNILCIKTKTTTTRITTVRENTDQVKSHQFVGSKKILHPIRKLTFSV